MYTNRFSKATRFEKHETCRPIPEGTRESEGREVGKRQLRLRLVIGRLWRILRSTFALRAKWTSFADRRNSLGLPSGPPSRFALRWATFSWLANRSSFGARGPTFALRATVGNLRLNHERRLVAQILPRWNRLQHWFELTEAFRIAA